MSKSKDSFNVHHRQPQSLGGDDSPENLSEVNVTKHIAWHVLFKDMNPFEIAREINETWLDYHYEIVIHKIPQP